VDYVSVKIRRFDGERLITEIHNRTLFIFVPFQVAEVREECHVSLAIMMPGAVHSDELVRR